MPKRGMEAVATKQQDMKNKLAAKLKRKPVMQRKGKGPGVAVMIAIGKPKGMGGPMDGPMGKGEDEQDEKMSKADKIAALEEKIGYLKAELALLKDESDEIDDEDMNESEDDSEDEEDEDEYE